MEPDQASLEPGLVNRAGEWMTADAALSRIQSGMAVAFPHLGAEPTLLTEALWRRATGLRDLTVYSGMLLSGYGFLKSEAARNITFKTWFMPGTLLRKSAADVRAEYLPLTWAQAARFLSEIPIDVALIQVSPADADGYHSVGNAVVTRAIANAARLVIAQVNERMPRTSGASLIHRSELDILVDGTCELTEFPSRPLDAVDLEVGRRIAGLVPDGAVVQLGIGAIPGAAVEGMLQAGKRDLAIINLLTDSGRRLIEAGCCRAENPKAMVGDVLGSHALYDWVDGNAAVALADVLTTHSVESFMARPGLVTINSALEIDLFGQVNSETLGGRQAGGMGGSVDFAIAGQVEGIRSVIGLRATTNDGASRIVTRLEWQIVSLSRTFVETVVTEYGTANLRNKTVNERAVALANVAHPDHRGALLDAAALLH